MIFITIRGSTPLFAMNEQNECLKVWVVPRASTDDQEFRTNYSLPAITPVETLIFDAFVHKDVYRVPLNWQSKLYTSFERQMPQTGVQLPLLERVENIGRGIEASLIPEVPAYADVLQYTVEII
jgi:hypothetical protein